MNTIGKIHLVLLISLISFTACKDKTNTSNSKQEVGIEKKEEVSKTYAEISIKEGGEWQGRKYVGENFTFKNVEFLRAPDSLTDHSYYVRYEGPGWESNKVGYRLYLDWRNAIDIFGKKVDTMVLSQVGVDNYDSYHEENPWGMDILKAGSSLGIGSYGRFDGSTVTHFQVVDSTTAQIHNEANESGVTVNYYGWEASNQKIDLRAQLMIAADSRLTKASLAPSKAGEGLCTGIVKFDGIDLIQKEGENGWAYIATYGEQTLVPDNLGMVIFYKVDEVETVTDAEFDHLLVFKPTTDTITYYFGGAWEQEKNGITTKDAFVAYLDSTLATLK